MNENDAYIFDIEEPKTWDFAGEPVWISGWFLSKVGGDFSDVRAVIDGVPYLGIFGLPREDLEQRHRGYSGRPHAGFSLRVQPPQGARHLRLELLERGGRWVEIWHTPIHVVQGPAPGARLRADIVPDQLRKLLQARRADPTGDLRPLARRLAVEAAAVTLDTLPNPPFFGSLENPLLTGGSQYGKLKVEGWIIHQQQRIRRLTGTTQPLAENELDYGDRPRAEAGELFPGHPYAARSQFFGLVDIHENAGDPAYLEIFAELEDGTRHLVFVHRFYQRACNQLERPLPEFSRGEFVAVVRLFIGACREQKIRLGPAGSLWRACAQAYRYFRRFAPASLAHLAHATPGPYAAWLLANQLAPRLQSILEAAAQKIADSGPRFVVLVETTGCTAAQLQACAESLRAQIYPRWEACFVGPMPLPALDARCSFVEAADPAMAIRALNAAAQRAAGTHLTLLAGHSRLALDALLEVAEAIVANPQLELVYTDEDRMDEAGRRSDPVFKPAWSPALADSGLFPGQLSVVRFERFAALGSFRPEFHLVPWFDLLLRLGDDLRASQVAHIPLIGHHADAGVPREMDPSHPSVEQARQALAAAMRRRGRPAAPFLPEAAHLQRRRFHQLRAEPMNGAQLSVTIVIPTRDKLHLLQECVELLDETVDWRHAQLIIVDDHSRDADAVLYLETIQRRKDLRCRVVRPADRSAPFNYSHLVNLAGPLLDTPLVLHLNNDVNALERGWLEEMTAWFQQPDVGVVGAKLVYPDKTLNHTGIVIGPHGGLADTPFAKVLPSDVPAEWHAAAREVSAVTGACLLTRTSLYQELGGFDEADFGVAFNDVDYCLRVRAAGHRIIYTPQAKLMHWGSATRGVTFDDSEHVAFVRRYPRFRDPYFSPHLALKEGRIECVGALPARTDRVGRLRLLLLTHNLNLEGAPLFLLEYATHLSQAAGFSLEVFATQEGPLRREFEALGARVTVADTSALFAATTEPDFRARVADYARAIAWDQVDLVVCNTLASFWGVHAARAAGKPSLFYIHESTSLFRFFEQKLALDLHFLAAQALEQATRVLFLCAATEAYYGDYSRNGNYRIVPSWIRLEAIDEFRRTHPRGELRRKLGFADDETVIANIGTVVERKGQHDFLRAIEHFNRHFGHHGKFRFLMVGARPGVFLDLLQRDIRRLGLINITFVPETRDVFDYFVAADLFVCSSYEESFPRVVMEAMAFRTPMVTTDVHGIAVMVGQRQDGYLVSPGDPVALSKMMRTCLAKERSGKSLTPTAYSKALRFFDSHKVLPRHVEIAKEAWLAGP